MSAALGASASASCGVIYQIAQFLAGLEVRNSFRRHFDARTSLWIPSNARLPLARSEAAKPADLDLIAFVEAVDNTFEDRLYDDFRVLTSHLDHFRHFVDQLSLRHTLHIPYVVFSLDLYCLITSPTVEVAAAAWRL